MSSLTLTKVLLKYLDSHYLLFCGVIVACASAVGSLLIAYFSVSHIFTIVIIMSLFSFSVGMISPHANGGAMHHFKDKAGPAGALMSTAVFFSAAVFSTIAMSFAVLHSLWPIAIYVGLTVSLCVCAYLSLK